MRRHNWSMLQGEHRAVLLGGELVGRVSSGLLLLSHTVQGQREHQLLVGAGDWLGTEWLGQPPTQLSMTAFTAVRASWRVIRPTAYPSVVIGCLQATLSQHQRRATELLALRTGSADERCRHFLHLTAMGQLVSSIPIPVVSAERPLGKAVRHRRAEPCSHLRVHQTHAMSNGASAGGATAQRVFQQLKRHHHPQASGHGQCPLRCRQRTKSETLGQHGHGADGCQCQ